MAIEIWFEFGSTYSYPAVERFPALAAKANIDIHWRAFLLGPIFNSQGWDNSPFNIYPAKGKYMWRDMERSCAAHGLPWRKPSVMPRFGLLASRIVCSFPEENWIPAFVQSVFRKNFVDDIDISQPSVIEDCLQAINVDVSDTIEVASSDEGKHRLREQTERAVALDIFGAPTFAIGGELFWGHDRMEEAIAWHQAHSP